MPHKNVRPYTLYLRIYVYLYGELVLKNVIPDYHIAVAGSLLGISLHENVSYPVGKVNVINLYPMSFEEFLMAKGEKEACKLLMSRDYVMMSLLHEKYVDLLRQYYYVGGMPEAVSKYVETGALREVRRIQQEILQGYDLDFSKHAPKEQVPRIRMVWNSVPSQLFKENKKFIYGALRKGARANDFELSIQWLVNAGLLYKVPRCAKPELPLAVYEDLSAFKLYMVGTVLTHDSKQALTWLEKSAEQGFVNAQIALGSKYVLGVGVEKGYEKALKWYSRAAKQGGALAQSCLGDMYREGLGTAVSYTCFFYLYKKAVDQGYAEAQANLGRMYVDGS